MAKLPPPPKGPPPGGRWFHRPRHLRSRTHRTFSTRPHTLRSASTYYAQSKRLRCPDVKYLPVYLVPLCATMARRLQYCSTARHAKGYAQSSHMTAGARSRLCATLCVLAPWALTIPVQARACGVVSIPALFVSQRVFAMPVAAADLRPLRFWVDSDGSGFIFDDVARRYGILAQEAASSHARAGLPRFVSSANIPPLTAHAGTLSVMRRAEVARDPIFDGLDGQLGASWL